MLTGNRQCNAAVVTVAADVVAVRANACLTLSVAFVILNVT